MVYTLQKIDREAVFIVNEQGKRVAWAFKMAVAKKWVVFSPFHQFLYEAEDKQSIIAGYTNSKNHTNWTPDNFETPVFRLEYAFGKSYYIVSEKGVKVARAYQNQLKQWDVLNIFPEGYLFTSRRKEDIISDYLDPMNYWNLLPLK